MFQKGFSQTNQILGEFFFDIEITLGISDVYKGCTASSQRQESWLHGWPQFSGFGAVDLVKFGVQMHKRYNSSFFISLQSSLRNGGGSGQGQHRHGAGDPSGRGAECGHVHALLPLVPLPGASQHHRCRHRRLCSRLHPQTHQGVSIERGTLRWTSGRYLDCPNIKPESHLND